MARSVLDVPLEIGQHVRRRGAPLGAPWGLVAGLIFVEPCVALVRWHEAPATFEPIDALINVEAPVLA